MPVGRTLENTLGDRYGEIFGAKSFCLFSLRGNCAAFAPYHFRVAWRLGAAWLHLVPFCVLSVELIDPALRLNDDGTALLLDGDVLCYTR